MIVSGSGEMLDLTSDSLEDVPWYEIRTDIYSLQFSSEITHIGSYVFKDCQFLLITLPTNLESIGAYAFLDCSRLRALEIPKTIEYVGYGAFKGCTNLYNLTLPLNMKNIIPASGSYNNLTPGVDLFAGCTNLTIVNYSGTIYDWLEFDFYNSGISLQTPTETVANLFILNESNESAAILNLELTNELGDIGDYQFYGVNNIFTVTIPSDYQCNVGDYAFSNSGLKEFFVYDKDFVFNEGVISNSENITIYGYKDSTAYEYCLQNSNINFLEISDLNIVIKDQNITEDGEISSNKDDVLCNGLIDGHKIEAISLIRDEHSIKLSEIKISDNAGNDVTNCYINLNITEGICHCIDFTYSDGKHYGACVYDGCSFLVDEEICYGNGATCENGAICIVCGNEYTDPLGHSYEWVDNVLATCESEGIKGHYKCLNCNELFNEEYNPVAYDDLLIAIASHSFTKIEKVQPDCDDAGVIEHNHCSMCGKNYDENNNIINDVSISPLGHSGGTATCINKPVCEICGNEYGDSLGHDYVWYDRVEESCEQAGLEGHYECSICNDLFDDNYNVINYENLIIDKLSHELTKIEKKPAGCETTGILEHYYCSLCKKTYTENGILFNNTIIPATGHVLDDSTWNAAVAPTCEDFGCIEHYKCSNCGLYFDKSSNLINEVLLPALGHSGGAATCVDRAVCDVCNKPYGSTLSHILNETTWHDGVDATCDSDGVLGHYECSGCNKYFNIELVEIGTIIIKGGHLLDSTTWHDEIPPTCESDGVLGHYECSGCNQFFNIDKTVINDIVIESGHTLGEWIDAVASSCYQSGSLGHYECSGCGKKFDQNNIELGDIVIKPSHVLDETTWHDEIPPTCDDEGVLGHYECSGCDETFDINKIKIDSITIDMTGHNANHETYVPLVPATCVKDGMLAHYFCATCNDYLTVDKIETTKEALIITAAGHKLDDSTWHVEIPATCLLDGSLGHYECSGCYKYFNFKKEEIPSIVIEQLEHVLNDSTWHAEVPATCFIEGVLEHYECSGCNGYFDVEGNKMSDIAVPVLEHVGGNASCQAKAICDLCSSEYGDYNYNVHNYSSEIYFDDKYHYNECSCGKKNIICEHSYGEWYEEDGLRKKECSCGHYVTATINKASGITSKKIAIISIISFSSIFSILLIASYIIRRKKSLESRRF